MTTRAAEPLAPAPPEPGAPARVPWWTAALVALACLQSQSHLVPVFVWSFLILVPVGLSASRDRGMPPAATPPWAHAGVWLLAALLVVTCAGSTRWESTVFLVSSVLGGALALRVCVRRRSVAAAAALLFVAVHVLLAVVAVADLALNLDLGVLIPSEDGSALRFRGLAMEPNHLGFSLCAAMLVLLYDLPPALARHALLRVGLMGAAVAMTAWTRSPFAMLMLLLIAAPRLWQSARGRALLLMLVVAGLVLANLSDRVAQIVEGEDSSANFRTWGSMLIGYLQLENCGPLGCGLGSGRDVLADEPLMAAFAAQETLVLPNLLAGAMVDGGWVLLALALVALVTASFPAHPGGRSRPVCWALFFLMFAYAASGSYPYDPHFWAALGMLAATTRREPAVGRGRARRAASSMSLGTA